MIVVDSNVIAYCWINGDQTALAQEFIPPRGGHITRIEVLGGRFLYAIGDNRKATIITEPLFDPEGKRMRG